MESGQALARCHGHDLRLRLRLGLPRPHWQWESSGMHKRPLSSGSLMGVWKESFAGALDGKLGDLRLGKVCLLGAQPAQICLLAHPLQVSAVIECLHSEPWISHLSPSARPPGPLANPWWPLHHHSCSPALPMARI